MPFCLLPLDGGMPIVLDAPELILGRHPGCDRVLAGPDTVSRWHCRVEQRGHYVQVFDLGSANGVRVNGCRIEQDAPLAPGDQLRLGGAEFVLALAGEAALAAYERRATPPAVAELAVTQHVASVLLDDASDLESPPPPPAQTAALPERFPAGIVPTAPENVPPPQTKPPPRLPGSRAPAPATSPRPAASSEAPRPPATLQKPRPAAVRASAVSPPALELSDKSWDMIVALERRAPEVKPPRQKELPPKEASASPERARTLGLVSRPAAGAVWDTPRLGLSVMHWSGIAAGLLFLLIWGSLSVPLFAEAARHATSVFSPFGDEYNVSPERSAAYGLQMVIIGALPVIVCLVLRNSVEEAFWPAVGVAVLCLVFGQVVRPSNPRAINVLCGAGLTLWLALCGLFLAGLLLACRTPHRSRLSRWGLIAAAATFAAIVCCAAVLWGESAPVPGLTLPARRPAAEVTAWLLILSAAFAQGLVLYFFRKAAEYLQSAPLQEAVETTLIYSVVASLAQAGAWLAAAGGHMAEGWGDVLLLAAAASGTISLTWIGQAAGHVRLMLR
jgi:pSer/pThr/pTyr-binding forkhead associated (FHA) protein